MDWAYSSIIIPQHLKENLINLPRPGEKMAASCLQFAHIINIAYHVIPSSVIALFRDHCLLLPF